MTNKIYIVYDQENDAIAEIESLPYANIITYDGNTYRVILKSEISGQKFVVLGHYNEV